MLYKLFIFLIFLSPLVFFHELGHFLFARFFGIRVEIFSLGFGKNLFSFKKGDTEYRFSLIPLGGFVKMYGDDPFNRDGIPEDQREFAYNHKSKWARFWVVFGGPLANFIFAFAIFFCLIFKGEFIRPFKIGKLLPESKLAAEGFVTGDILKKINGEEIYSQEDFLLLAEDVNTFEVSRNDQEVMVESKLTPEDFLRDFYLNSESLVQPVLLDKDARSFEIKFEKKSMSLQEIFAQNPSELLIVDKDGKELKLERAQKDWKDFLIDSGLYSKGLSVKSVIDNSPAQKAQLMPGDIIIGGELIAEKKDVQFFYFDDLRDFIQESKGTEVKLKIQRNSTLVEVSLQAQEKSYGDQTFYTMGVESSVDLFRPDEIFIAGSGVFSSIKKGFNRTLITLYKTFDGFRKIFSSKNSFESLGGPVAIATVASDSLKVSIEQFLRLMAIISVNLGLINLFPIPVLDGGHIVFLIVEFFNRGPLSKKKMEIAQQFGISLLFILIGLALYNDITRFLI
jgi:regulator of sigma E protease